MKAELKCVFTAAATALLLAMASGTLADDDVVPACSAKFPLSAIPGIPIGGKCKLGDVIVTCGSVVRLVTTFLDDGTEKQAVCTGTTSKVGLALCNQNPTITNPPTESVPACLVDTPLSIPDDAQRYRGSCTTCSTVSGVRKCYTNFSINC